MAENKIAAYLGFARRAGKLALGVNAVSCCKGGVQLLVADNAASENTKKEIGKLTRRFSVPLVWVDGLGGAAGKEGCVLAAVKEEHLARAILDCVAAAE